MPAQDLLQDTPVISGVNDDAIRAIDFGLTPMTEALIEGAQKVAASIDISIRSRSAAAAMAQNIERIRELGLNEVLADVDDGTEPTLTFHVAERLAYANTAAAWQGLSNTALVKLKTAPETTAIAFGKYRKPGESSEWVRWIPVCEKTKPTQVLLIDARAATSTVVSLDDTRLGAARSDMLGFPFGAIEKYNFDCTYGDKLSSTALNTAVSISAALVAGLISGSTRRLLFEALEYSKIRHSGGKPIFQHQAVALRLADIVIHQKSLELYLAGQVESCEVQGAQGGPQHIHAGYVGDSAFKISRDAVQIAAGHGYVEGLPFRRLFEQIRALVSALSLL
ncbi:MAG: acyl-CoA dehydrogenase family protein [Myxococcota bacterium]